MESVVKVETVFKRIAMLVVFILFSSAILVSSINATWWNDSYEFRKEINITSVSAETLTDFPAYLNISKEIGMQNNFSDLRFTNTSCGGSNVGLLDYEIEQNLSTHAVVWVRIPSLPTSGFDLCMYYGNSSVDDIADPNGVWKSNYALVYHMDSAGNDSTSNNRDRVSDVGGPVVNNTFLGHGMYFDGVNDGWSWQDIAYLEQQWSERTHEIIFETAEDITTKQTLFAEGGSVNGIAMYVQDGLLFARWWSETQGWAGDHLSYAINASSVYHASMEYSQVGATYTYRLYVDGRDVNSSTTADFINAHSGNGGVAYTGGNTKDFHDLLNSAGHYYQGNIHEMRVYDDNETAGWVNMSAYNTVVDHSATVSYGSQQENKFGIVVDDPSTASTYIIKGNKTFDYNITVTCHLGSGSSCGNISLVTQYNASPIANISTTPATTPTWINDSVTLQPQSCVLNAGQSCSLSWEINMSGEVDEQVKIRTRGMSNDSSLALNFTENLTVEIAANNAVAFNLTTLTIPSFTKNTGNGTKNASVVSSIGNNTVINVSCSQGNCSEIKTNWVNGTQLNESQSLNTTFTCDDRVSGNYWAIFGVVSAEDRSPNNINVSCVVLPVFGPISINLTAPDSSILNNVSHDQEFELNATVDCNGTCGNITAFAVTDKPFGDGSDGSLSVSTVGVTVNNYTQVIGDESAGNVSIAVGDSSTFSSGDEILIIQMQNGSGIGDAGNYEFAIINTTSAGVINLTSALTKSYGSGTFDSTRASATQIIRVPHYVNVTISSGGTITAPAWNGSTGGVVVFKVNNTINTSGGPINVTALGYRGGDCNSCGDNAWGDQGESYIGLGISSQSANTTGGGGGYGPTGFGGEPGGGGGHATRGANGTGSFTMEGGYATGMSNLTKIFFGGGAGGGGDNDNLAPFAEYVDGGGIAIVYGKTFVNATVYAHGEKGIISQNNGGTTGAGAGGTIWITSENLSVTNVSAEGEDTVAGYGSDNGGAGGDGRIRLDYVIGGTITTTPLTNYTGSVAEMYTLISTTPGDTPLWINGSSNPQSCLIAEDGSCIFSWTINGSGDVNTTPNISVIATSNFSSISGVITEEVSVKIINVIPRISVVEPLNNSYLIYDGDVNLTWFINDTDDFTLRCVINVNGTNVHNQTCFNGNNSYVANVSVGLNNWSVRVYDNINSTNTTGLNFLTTIQENYKRIDKAITNIGNDQYLIKLFVTNYLNTSSDVVVIDFVDQLMNAFSFTPSTDITNVTHVNPYHGTLHGWNLTMVANTTTELNYSITPAAANNDYELSEHFIVGLD